MKPYGKHRPIKHNYEDCHPIKPYYNWWEIDCDKIDKKATRRKARENIKIEEINYMCERE